MRLFAITHLDTAEASISHFPMRTADTAGDYVVALLLGGQGDTGIEESLWRDFLAAVVLRHVYNVEPKTVSVVSYSSITDCVTLADSNPSRTPAPGLECRRGWTKRMIDASRKEPTADTYVVPVFKIMSNLANADEGDRRWGIIDSDVQAPCAYRLTIDLSEANNDGTVKAIRAPVAVDLTAEAVVPTAVQGPTKKRCIGAAASAAEQDDDDDEQDDE